MKWTDKGHQFDKIGKLFRPNLKAYVYGAGENGRDLFCRMSFANCIEAFIDNDTVKQEEGFCGKNVLSLSGFLLEDKKEHIVIIAQSLQNTVISKRQLLNAGYEEGRTLFDYHTFIQFYLPIYAVYSWNKVYIPTVSMLMTTKCNLDCKGCLNFTHVNKNLVHYSIERLKNDVDCIFDKVDMIGLFHLTGGEPLLYPHFIELIVYINQKYRDKIFKLGTTINGTIIPSDDLCIEMEKARMTVWVDDYRENVEMANQKYENVLEKLEAFKIKFIENCVDGWIDIQKGYENEQESEVKVRCLSCSIPFVSLKDHKIYGCNYSDYASEAGIVQESGGDFLDLLKIDGRMKKELIEYTMGYSPKGYYSFCPQCRGSISINVNKIPVAEQY